VIGLGIHLRHVIRLVPPGSVWSVSIILAIETLIGLIVGMVNYKTDENSYHYR